MSHTYKHQTKYRAKKKWADWIKQGCPEIHPDTHYESCVLMGETRRKKWIERELNRKFRRQWRQALYKPKEERWEKLSTKPNDSAWEIW